VPRLTFACCLVLAAARAFAGWDGEVEGGAVFAGYNDVSVPGDGGTRVSLTDELSTDVGWFYRLRFGYTFNDRHTLSALVAPLSVDAGGTAPADVLFDGVTFPAGTNLAATYRFDSYRLTYRYTFGPWGRFRLGLGATAKLRDAAIALEGGGLAAEKTNVGVVPLVNFRLTYALAERVTLVWEGDALAAPQGRAEDVFLGAVVPLTATAAVKGGYRVLEGGVDVAEVYNVALFHYAAAALVLSF